MTQYRQNAQTGDFFRPVLSPAKRWFWRANAGKFRGIVTRGMLVFLSLAGQGEVIRAQESRYRGADRGPRIQEPRRFESEHACMGIRMRIVLVGAETEQARAAAAEIWELADRLDQMLSDYKPDSDAMRLAASAPHEEPVPVDPLFWRILAESSAISQMTGGAFDVTAGPLTHLWRQSIRRNRLPADEAVAAARQRVGWQLVELLPNHQVRLHGREMRLDFGGIAQGFFCDLAGEITVRRGITSALIDASGDLLILGSEDGTGRPWRIAIPSGRETPEDLVLELRGPVAVTTSGDKYQHLSQNGARYSHIVEPATGRATQSVSSATVLAPRAALADALATALVVLPLDAASRLAGELEDVEVQIVPQRVERETESPGPDVFRSAGFPGPAGFSSQSADRFKSGDVDR